MHRSTCPSTCCLTRPFNATSLRPFNASLRHRASFNASINVPLQRVARRTPSMQRHCAPSMRRSVVVPPQRIVTLSCPFNASFDAPLQRVVRRAPSTRCSTCPFNAMFDVPLQCVIRRAHSTQLCCTPSTRCPMRPFNASSLRASSSSMRCLTHPSTCRQHAPFNVSSSCTLPRVVVRVSATRLCSRHYAHCWRVLSRYVDAPFYCVAVE
jgi:hypothetical protein